MNELGFVSVKSSTIRKSLQLFMNDLTGGGQKKIHKKNAISRQTQNRNPNRSNYLDLVAQGISGLISVSQHKKLQEEEGDYDYLLQVNDPLEVLR